jgi:formate dehydrogenase major subunit
MAECHPVGFQWVMKAKERGATIIHADPRFTRTSAVADVYAPIRPGTDIAFLGGLIHYIIENERYFREYIVNYTNAPAIVNDGFRDVDEEGFFCGWDAERGEYDFNAWMYKEPEGQEPGKTQHSFTGQAHAERAAQARATHFDYTLQDPFCVFQILKRHYARYTAEMVERICGTPRDLFLRVAKTLCDNSGRDRTSYFCYAVGWTQHVGGPQIIRAAAIVQGLLGNMGRPGGGIMALRGHASIQGSTDIPTLYDLLPGYLAMPKANATVDFATYCEHNVSEYGWWSESKKYIVSLLKAWYGDRATVANDWCYGYLPHLQGEHSHLTTVVNQIDRVVKGYFVMGENPAVGSPHAGMQRKGLRNLEWLVVRDFAPTETSDFWKESPEHRRGEVRAEDIATEVFFFPAATHTEKDGTFTNTQRLLQWHHKAIEPPGDSRSDLHFVYHLGRRLQEMYADSTEKRDGAIRDLTWSYGTEGEIEEPSAEDVLKEINGFTVVDGKAVSSYTELKDDGSTACGCWIYSGVYANGKNQSQNRKAAGEQNWVANEWGWAWPSNRRILYNRASADPDGKPWSERKKLVWWDEASGRWTGFDNPDMIVDRAPSYKPLKAAKGLDALSGTDPFILHADGVAWLFSPNGLQQGPMPTYYEPPESVMENLLYKQQCDPTRMEYQREQNPLHQPIRDKRFPYLMTTYRVTEHHTAGAMSRWLSWLSELQPAAFCEISPELAREVGVRNGDWATVSTGRAAMEARVLVTERLRPIRLDGRTFHQVGIPYHWGSKGLTRGDSANELVALLADANVTIMQSKAMTCCISPGCVGHEKHREAALGPRMPDALLRDLPQAQHRPKGKHGVVAGQSKQGEQT